MTGHGDYRSEMADTHAHDELQDLLNAGSMTGGPLSPVVDFLAQLQTLEAAPPDFVVARHLTMLRDEAATIPAGAPVAQGSTGPLVRRRRVAFGTLMSGFLVKALIGTAALAAVGTGAAVTSDGAVPGDALYGLDRAFERVGINHGGAAERIEEAMVLVEAGDHNRAIATVEEAIESLAGESADASAIGALHNAAAQITAVRTTGAAGYRDTQAFRDQVAALLGVIATEMENGSVDGARIAETAKRFSDTARAFADTRGSALDGAPPADSQTPPGPPDSLPNNKPDTPPGQENKADHQP